MRIYILFILILTCTCGHCQDKYFNVCNLTKDSIPSDTLYKGKFIEGKKWTDKNGQNLLIVSRIGPKILYFPDGTAFFWKTFFFINRYVKQNQFYKLYCQYTDSVRGTYMIPTWASLLFNSNTVTDLDSNGIAETIHIFCNQFSSDVQPPDMKLVFNDGYRNCVLNGQMYFRSCCPIKSITDTTNLKKFEYDLEKLYLSKGRKYNSQDAYDNHLTIGRYENSHDFDSLPPIFIEFARKIWSDNMCNLRNEELMMLYGRDFIW